MATPDRHPLELRIPPPVIAGTAALAQWLCTRRVPPPPRSRRAVAVTLLAAGATIGVLGVRNFGAAGTTIHPQHPERAQTLVTAGPYRWTRNPMYLGMAVGLLAIAIDRGKPVALLPILGYGAYLTRFQIRPEEAALRARFGQDYDTYAKRVRRWI